MNTDGMHNLITAIVRRAVKDWYTAQRGLHRSREGTDRYRHYMRMLVSAEKFLESDWCAFITDIDKGYFLEQIRKEQVNKYGYIYAPEKDSEVVSKG